MKKRPLFLVKFAVVFSIVSAILVKYSSLSPYDFYVFRSRNSDEYMKPVKMLHEDIICDGSYIIFFINERANLACAMIEKRLFSYNLLSACAEIPLHTDDKPANLSFGGYGYGNSPMVLVCWGVINDDSVTKVLILGNEAAIVETDGLRICYYSIHGDKVISGLNFFDYELLDEQGSRIPR